MISGKILVWIFVLIVVIYYCYYSVNAIRKKKFESLEGGRPSYGREAVWAGIFTITLSIIALILITYVVFNKS